MDPMGYSFLVARFSFRSDQDGSLTPEMQRALDTAFDRCTGQGVFWHVLVLMPDICIKHVGLWLIFSWWM